jgi:hypothetical protein
MIKTLDEMIPMACNDLAIRMQVPNKSTTISKGIF